MSSEAAVNHRCEAPVTFVTPGSFAAVYVVSLMLMSIDENVRISE